MIHLIWAEARNGVIGSNGSIPWRVPGEQEEFRRLTTGGAVVMGRATWDSLTTKPLPDRLNYVLTRQVDWCAQGAIRALLPPRLERELWVMGGRQIYDLYLPEADHIVRTRIDIEASGDTHAPDLGEEWAVRTRRHKIASSGVSYVIEDLYPV